MTRIRRARRLATDVAGTVLVEYTIALALVAVGLSLAAIALGVTLLELYRFQVALISSPFP